MKKSKNYPKHEAKPAELKDAVLAYRVEVEDEAMVRTQIYLSRREHEFIQGEADRRNAPMAAVIRLFIDEKMEIPADAWTNNPMLLPPIEDLAFEGHEDGAINHDHYIYGGPKKWMKQNGKWVETPPLPEDYYDNPASQAAYDAEVEKRK
jgi:hypothetical protein